jgi:hypothetical protein
MDWNPPYFPDPVLLFPWFPCHCVGILFTWMLVMAMSQSLLVTNCPGWWIKARGCWREEYNSRQKVDSLECCHPNHPWEFFLWPQYGLFHDFCFCIIYFVTSFLQFLLVMRPQFTTVTNILSLTTYIFKCALKKFFKKQHKVPVFFERNFKTSHLQIQTVPVPCDMATRLKDVFQVP